MNLVKISSMVEIRTLEGSIPEIRTDTSTTFRNWTAPAQAGGSAPQADTTARDADREPILTLYLLFVAASAIYFLCVL